LYINIASDEYDVNNEAILWAQISSRSIDKRLK